MRKVTILRPSPPPWHGEHFGRILAVFMYRDDRVVGLQAEGIQRLPEQEAEKLQQIKYEVIQIADRA